MADMSLDYHPGQSSSGLWSHEQLLAADTELLAADVVHQADFSLTDRCDDDDDGAALMDDVMDDVLLLDDDDDVAGAPVLTYYMESSLSGRLSGARPALHHGTTSPASLDTAHYSQHATIEGGRLMTGNQRTPPTATHTDGSVTMIIRDVSHDSHRPLSVRTYQLTRDQLTQPAAHRPPNLTSHADTAQCHLTAAQVTDVGRLPYYRPRRASSPAAPSMSGSATSSLVPSPTDSLTYTVLDDDDDDDDDSATTAPLKLPTASELNAALFKTKEASLSDSECDSTLNREAHNAKERARRSRIKVACERLKRSVPGLTSKTDKASVFEVTVRYIAYLRQLLGPQHPHCDTDFLKQCSLYPRQ